MPLPEAPIFNGPILNGLGKILAECFTLSLVTSLFTQLRDPHYVPPLRVLIATGFYTGFSGCAIAVIWITYYGAEHSSFLYFTSMAAGLGTADVLSAVWSKVVPSVVNYAWRKVTGENLVNMPGSSCQSITLPIITPEKPNEPPTSS